MKKLFVLLSLIVSINTQNLLPQQPFILNNGIFKYWIGKSEPPSEWKNVDFDDSDWQSADSAVIGYGWPKATRHFMDSVVIEKCSSLYVRIIFDIETVENQKNWSLNVDYDDGFVVYLNGYEIARKNLGKPGDYITYDRLADRSHEATIYRRYDSPVNGLYIDSTVVKASIKPGKNVLAFQVHNDSIDGSDLSLLCSVTNLEYEYNYNIYDKIYRYYRQVPLVSSKFPIVLIETDEYGIPYTSEVNGTKRVIAQMKIIDNPNGQNSLNDPITFQGRISIERRGESSAWFPKMSFNLETQDESGNNLDTAIMGIPADNDWVLFSSFADKSLIKNELVFNLGRRMGHYEPRTRFCELVLNGEYMGLYYFMEKIKRGKNRVSVSKRDTTGNPAEGGYVFKYDKPESGIVQFVYPKKDEVTQAEKDYINNFINSFKKVLKSNQFLDPVEGYRKYVSTKSLIDYVIINELSKNCDAYLYSTYFHKDKESKDRRIKYGPLWDYDLAFGGAAWQEGTLTSKWQYEYNTNLQIKLMFRDTALSHAFARRWWELRSNLLSNSNLMHLIDSLTSTIYDSRILNYRVWPVEDKFIFGPDHYSYSYDNEIFQIKDWLTKRLQWIDANIDKIYYPLDIHAPTFAYSPFAVEAYPNPFHAFIKVKILGKAGNYIIRLQSADGRIMATQQTYCIEDRTNEVLFRSPAIESAKPGLYFIVIMYNGQVVQAEKVVKE